MIQTFHEIKDYYRTTGIRLSNIMDDFACFEFSDLHDEIQPNIRAYANNFYEITFDIKSECNFKIDTFSFEGATRQLSVISPHRVQSVEISDNFTANDNKGFTVFFDTNFISNTVKLKKQFPFLNRQYSPQILLTERTLDELRTLFNIIRYEYLNYGNSSREVLQNLVLAVLNKAVKDYKHLPPQNKILSKEEAIMFEFESLVQEKFKHLSTVKEYAAKMNVTPKYLSRCVKSASGDSALKRINCTRMEYAKSLLLHTNSTISEIAWELNFRESAYFFTAFKRMTGLSPNDFRKKNLQ